MSKKYTKKEILEMWPQAAGELAGFANRLRQGNAGLTAAQLDMAIQMGNELLDIIKNETNSTQRSSSSRKTRGAR